MVVGELGVVVVALLYAVGDVEEVVEGVLELVEMVVMMANRIW